MTRRTSRRTSSSAASSSTASRGPRDDRGPDTQQARREVVARLGAENDDEADEQTNLIERGIQQHGERVTIRAPTLLRGGPLFFFGRGPRIDYQVTVPRASRGRLTSRSGGG